MQYYWIKNSLTLSCTFVFLVNLGVISFAVDIFYKYSLLINFSHYIYLESFFPLLASFGMYLTDVRTGIFSVFSFLSLGS